MTNRLIQIINRKAALLSVTAEESADIKLLMQRLSLLFYEEWAEVFHTRIEQRIQASLDEQKKLHEQETTKLREELAKLALQHKSAEQAVMKAAEEKRIASMGKETLREQVYRHYDNEREAHRNMYKEASYYGYDAKGYPKRYP